jgi:murein DD-endopeptidase MepM/ murein hydrolase activator NlpD
MRTAFLGLFALAIAFAAQPAAAADTASVRVADGFDFPVGKPDARCYHKARGFTPDGHLGEDWNGDGGGNTDLGDPVYCIGNGIVVFAADVHLGWGNVVIVRHAWFEDGQLTCIDSLYGHLNEILVRPGDAVERGQKIGAIGTAHGIYDAHLHLEIRKNLAIGMNRAAFARDYSNYFDPTQFIQRHRTVSGNPDAALVAINTFSHPANSYSGPSGVRFAASDFNPGNNAGGHAGGHNHTLYFSLSSGDVPVAAETKPIARHTAFKVDRFGDIKFN